MSLPQNVSLTLYQDDDFSQNFLWANPSASQPLNPALVTWLSFASCTASMQVRQTSSSSSTQYLALSTPSSGLVFSTIQPPGSYATPTSNNAFTITITATQTLAIPVGTNFYDLVVVYPSGLRTYFLQGQFNMLPTVTR
jgi:hypothetical protein